MSILTPMRAWPGAGSGEARVPEFPNLEAFRRWAREERPEQGRFAFLDGSLWVDLAMEHG